MTQSRPPRPTAVTPATFHSRLIVIVGDYGSGKTEVAVNLASQLQKSEFQVSIADMDVVNPYFRCREARQWMAAQGIRVVMPPEAQQHADLPIVVPQTKAMLHPDDGHISIFDVGGDDVGATLLSSFFENLADAPYQLLQVINGRRPFTNTVEGCLKMKAAIERASRLQINGLIVNTHLIDDTTVDVIMEGYEMAVALSKQSPQLPIVFVAAMDKLAHNPQIAALPVPVLALGRLMAPPWLRTNPKQDNPSEQIDRKCGGRIKPIGCP